ncbi:MAG: HlyD family efflux transporter periplasmic adaptor subunit [Sporolactobacillus sp.]|jgi:HlyD family secretion protein|nr:HlyD family efflux transporter periplasmic adaptor subunit [Sporolactobacillus sp.]
MKKLWIILLVVILAAAGGLTWFLTRDRSASAQVLYTTTTVRKGTISSDVNGSGQLKAAVDEDIVADADDASKTIDTVKVSADDTVDKGDTLLTFTDGSTLTAPHDGTITKVNVYEGDRITAGRALMHLTNYADLNAVIQIDELDITKVKKGQNVSIDISAYPNKTFSGKVTSIAQTGTNTNGVSTFDVTVHLSKSSGLKPGMTANANIILQKKSNVLYLPSGAVHQSGNRYYVYLSSGTSASSEERNGFAGNTGMGMDQKRGRTVEVKTGMHNDESIEITSGLKEGQSVQVAAISRRSSTSGSQSQSGSQSGQMMGPSGSGGQGTGGQGFRRQFNNGGGGGNNQ